jgi:hypothetical protein
MHQKRNASSAFSRVLSRSPAEAEYTEAMPRPSMGEITSTSPCLFVRLHSCPVDEPKFLFSIPNSRKNSINALLVNCCQFKGTGKEFDLAIL